MHTLIANVILPQDVQRLMSFVNSRDRVNREIHANYELFESWRQLVEVMLHSLVHGNMKKELKMAVLFELIQDLLLKVELLQMFRGTNFRLK